jgi:dienelactone hydrolase
MHLAAALMVCAGAVAANPVNTADAPPTIDKRLVQIRETETRFEFPKYSSRAEWEARAEELRHQILFSAGLWPQPPKTPLRPRIFGKIERPGYTIEKVFFESVPGFYCTGNLYRPSGMPGPHPAVLSPHGHWQHGRLEDSELGSIPARCINLARQGFVVFAYDMVGYNDSLQIPHTFDGKREQLWGITLLGLQLLNSIRAVDFVSSLPDVDPSRIGCTGASGGGTQTFLLCAVDKRVKVGAPVNMISAHYQGGCLCENAPGLRVDTFNVEIAALMAPRPLLMVSATGDWTVNTPKVEYPAVRSIYALYKAEDNVHQVQFDAPHNYNRQSREAVYAWFGRHLLGKPRDWAPKEEPYTAEPPEAMRVFPDGKLPDGTPDAKAITEYLIRTAASNLEALMPRTRRDLLRFRQTLRDGLRHCLCVQIPKPEDVKSATVETHRSERFTASKLVIWRPSVGDRIPGVLYRPSTRPIPKRVALVVDSNGTAAFCGSQLGTPSPLVALLLRRGCAVLSIDPFLVGEARPANWQGRKEFRFFTTFNRTNTAERVQDVLTALAYIKARFPKAEIAVWGRGTAGIWCLLAAGLASQLDALAIDACGLDTSNDESFLGDLFVPGLRRVGDVRAAASLCAPAKLMLYNTQGRFQTKWAEWVYLTAGVRRYLHTDASLPADEAVVRWLTR